METTKENFLFLLAHTWLELMHLAKHPTGCRNVLSFRPFHQPHLLISFLTSVLNLTYIFLSMLSLRQNSLLWSSLELSYLHWRSFLWIYIHLLTERPLMWGFAYQPSTEYIWWFFTFSLQILEKREWVT